MRPAARSFAARSFAVGSFAVGALTAGPFTVGLILFAAQSAAAAIGFGAVVLLSRGMTPEDFGLAMGLISLAGLGSVLATGNQEAAAFRVISAGPDPARAGYVAATRSGTLWRSVTLGLLALALWRAGGAPLSGVLIALACALVPAIALLRLGARIGAALDMTLRAALPRIMARPLGFLGCGLVGLWIAPGAADLLGFALAALGMCVAFQWATQARRIRALGPAVAPDPAWRRTGYVLMPSLFFLEYFRDLCIAAAFLALGSADLARLSLAFALAALPGFAVIAADMALAPRMARLHAQGRRAPLGRLLWVCGLARLGALGLCVLCLVAGQPLIAGALPGEYAGIWPLVWGLLAVPGVRALVGNPIALLTLSDLSARVLRVTGPALPVCGAAIWGGGVLAGVEGAVFGIAASAVAVHLTLWWVCWRHGGIDSSGLLPRPVAPPVPGPL